MISIGSYLNLFLKNQILNNWRAFWLSNSKPTICICVMLLLSWARIPLLSESFSLVQALHQWHARLRAHRPPLNITNFDHFFFCEWVRLALFSFFLQNYWLLSFLHLCEMCSQFAQYHSGLGFMAFYFRRRFCKC